MKKICAPILLTATIIGGAGGLAVYHDHNSKLEHAKDSISALCLPTQPRELAVISITSTGIYECAITNSGKLTTRFAVLNKRYAP